MIDRILGLHNAELDAINMEVDSWRIKDDEYFRYFNSLSGREHYRLLSWISENIHGSVVDIGTHKGLSALAFSRNRGISVASFDIVNRGDRISDKTENVDYFVEDILSSNKRDDMLAIADVILLDTLHRGDYESLMYDRLCDVGFHGLLVLDDIKLNPNMVSFWDSIEKEKHDISSIGHSTGTGVVVF